MHSRDLIKEVEALGWRQARKRGSHVVLKHPTLKGNLSVPHPKDLGTGIVEKLRQLAKEGYALPSPDRTKDR